HGPMVFGTCRRILRHRQDAEDASQAALLVLARKAALLTDECVGPWLYGVACHIALKHRDANARACTREHQAAAMKDEASPHPNASQLAVVDEILKSLPEDLRKPIILCVLEGWKCDEAAKQLGWSLRTLERRLGKAKELLRERLTA